MMVARTSKKLKFEKIGICEGHQKWRELKTHFHYRSIPILFFSVSFASIPTTHMWWGAGGGSGQVGGWVWLGGWVGLARWVWLGGWVGGSGQVGGRVWLGGWGEVIFQSVDRRTHECYWVLSRQQHLDGRLRDHQIQITHWHLCRRMTTDNTPTQGQIKLAGKCLDCGLWQEHSCHFVKVFGYFSWQSAGSILDNCDPSPNTNPTCLVAVTSTGQKVSLAREVQKTLELNHWPPNQEIRRSYVSQKVERNTWPQRLNGASPFQVPCRKTISPQIFAPHVQHVCFSCVPFVVWAQEPFVTRVRPTMWSCHSTLSNLRARVGVWGQIKKSHFRPDNENRFNSFFPELVSHKHLSLPLKSLAHQLRPSEKNLSCSTLCLFCGSTRHAVVFCSMLSKKCPGKFFLAISLFTMNMSCAAHSFISWQVLPDEMGHTRRTGRTFQVIWGGSHDLSQIGASQIEVPIGSVFQKYVCSSFIVKMRINLGTFGLFWFILGWG